ncbi:sensor histidine kinase [Tenacibaculum sp. nBUS_03]|uniref:sensor histidine kinase n=1 Tax=Tenacibaculum sp. nBUS_03 TaxID=3395320 RepID=UPI003EBAA7A7
MIAILKKNNWFLIKVVVFISIIIPVGITTYEIVILNKNSIVFLGNYPQVVSIVVLIYYGLLLVMGIVWGLKQLKALIILKNEKVKNELLHLQSQVNPHFFFNMLNNLYGLIDKDTEQSKALILKLSDLMRYSIYEGAKNKVPLKDEITYLQNYIELHQMRYHKNIDIQFTVNIDNYSIQIIPLLFIILVENAFKHGVENLRESSYVYINLKTSKGAIHFNIENNFDSSELPEREGIGLNNLARRLELVYPNNHKLVFTDDNSVFKASLFIRV